MPGPPGRVGVCLVTSGPGATNTVTGIATAYMDSIPIVVFTGQVPTPLIGNDAFQEVDIVGITRPCTKHNYLVKDVKDLARSSRRPFTSPAPAGPDRCWWTCPRMCSQAQHRVRLPRDVDDPQLQAQPTNGHPAPGGKGRGA